MCFVFLGGSVRGCDSLLLFPKQVDCLRTRQIMPAHWHTVWLARLDRRALTGPCSGISSLPIMPAGVPVRLTGSGQVELCSLTTKVREWRLFLECSSLLLASYVFVFTRFTRTIYEQPLLYKYSWPQNVGFLKWVSSCSFFNGSLVNLM